MFDTIKQARQTVDQIGSGTGAGGKQGIIHGMFDTIRQARQTVDEIASGTGGGSKKGIIHDMFDVIRDARRTVADIVGGDDDRGELALGGASLGAFNEVDAAV